MLNNSVPEVSLGPQYHQTVRITIILCMIFLSLIGNSMVCFRLLRHRRRGRTKILFLHLAVADLLVTLVTMTSQVIWEVMGRRWVAGDAFCRIFKVLQTFALVSSIYMLVSIALDRHYAIVQPLTTAPGARRLAVGAWLASLLPSVPNLLLFRVVRPGPPGTACYCTSVFYTAGNPPHQRQIYMAFVFLSVFILPFFLLLGLYARILVEIKRQSMLAKSGRLQQSGVSCLPRAKVKTLKMTLVIFLAFMVTNVPYVAQELVLALGYRSLDKNMVALFGVVSASNSALNPYIYLLFHRKTGQRSCFGRCETLVKSLRWYYEPSPKRDFSTLSKTSTKAVSCTVGPNDVVRITLYRHNRSECCL